MKSIINSKGFLIFVILDVLFFPYLHIVVFPLSGIFILLWSFTNVSIIKSSSFYNAILICVLIMIFSTIFGCVYNSSYGVASDNIKRLIQYTIAFLYFFYFTWALDIYRLNVKRIMIIFVLFVVVFAVLFQTNLSVYSKITVFFNKGNTYNQSMGTDIWSTFRFNFIWTDPNNIAYAISGIVFFLVTCFDCKLYEKIILFISNLFILVSSMSSGGWITFGICLIFYSLFEIFKKKKMINRFNVTALFLNFVAIVTIILLFYNGVFDKILQSEIVQAALDRLENNEESRTEIWLRILNGDNIFKYILWGKGDTLIVNGVKRAAHSGHLYWVYAYGFVSYFIFIKAYFYLGFKNVWRYITIIPFFLCFTMNTMVGEQKLLLLFIFIICYLRRLPNESRIGQFNNTCL